MKSHLIGTIVLAACSLAVLQTNVNAAPPTFKVGTTKTGAPGTKAKLKLTKSGDATIFNFTIPRGNTGASPFLLNGNTAEFNGEVLANILSTDGTNGSFFVNTGFPPNQNTTLMGSFNGAASGPQLRFTRDTGGVGFFDIGEDGDNHFTIEANDSPALTITQTGSVSLGNPLPFAKFQIDHTPTGLSGDMLWAIRRKDSSGDILYMRTFADAGPFNLELFEGQAFKPGGGAWGVVSDRRLKKNIEPLSGALEKMLKLRSVTYEYKEPEKVHQFAGSQVGFVAQEVEEVFPEWVTVNAEGYKTVTIRGFESMTVEAVRELRQEKDAEIAELKAENTRLKQQFEKQAAATTLIESRLAKLEANAVGKEAPSQQILFNAKSTQ
jgi:hypothetical protein